MRRIPCASCSANARLAGLIEYPGVQQSLFFDSRSMVLQLGQLGDCGWLQYATSRWLVPDFLHIFGAKRPIAICRALAAEWFCKVSLSSLIASGSPRHWRRSPCIRLQHFEAKPSFYLFILWFDVAACLDLPVGQIQNQTKRNHYENSAPCRGNSIFWAPFLAEMGDAMWTQHDLNNFNICEHVRAGLNTARLRLGLGSSSSEILHLLLQNTQQHYSQDARRKIGKSSACGQRWNHSRWTLLVPDSQPYYNHDIDFILRTWIFPNRFSHTTWYLRRRFNFLSISAVASVFFLLFLSMFYFFFPLTDKARSSSNCLFQTGARIDSKPLVGPGQFWSRKRTTSKCKK